MCLTTLLLSGIFRHKTYILPPRMLIYLFAGAALYPYHVSFAPRFFAAYAAALHNADTTLTLEFLIIIIF